MSLVDKVIISNRTTSRHNIHLAVHPFSHNGIIMMMQKGDYDNHRGDVLAEWKQKLADSLWDKIPGLHSLFFQNGEITIQHVGLYSDEEIISEAEAIIMPVLKGQLLLRSV